jgi:hypothetical protein
MGQKHTTDDAAKVHCAEHGTSDACIICRHLREGWGLRYYAIKGDPWAWCQECDAVLEAEQGWSDRLYDFADWKVYCHKCFRRTLGRHNLVEWIEFEELEEGD